MKKSEILNILSELVTSYQVDEYGALTIVVKSIGWSKLANIVDYISFIMPIDNTCMRIEFDLSVEID